VDSADDDGWPAKVDGNGLLGFWLDGFVGNGVLGAIMTQFFSGDLLQRKMLDVQSQDVVDS